MTPHENALGERWDRRMGIISYRNKVKRQLGSGPV
jgi:hypothetical protein